MKCKICNTDNGACFSSKILNRYSVDYFHCKNCNFIQTEEPYWLDEAYARPVNMTDTGYIDRNLSLSKKMTILLFCNFKKDAMFLDYAGGYGVFVRLMRDVGFNYFWDDKYTTNLFASGFEWGNGDKDIEAITVFECFEHFKDPIGEIQDLLKKSRNIILSTTLVPEPIPGPGDWWYYGLDHGQHISFYTENTFNFIANEFGLNYRHCDNIHFLTDKRIPSYKIKMLKLTRLGLHTIIKRKLRSKTWEDCLRMTSLIKQGENK